MKHSEEHNSNPFSCGCGHCHETSSHVGLCEHQEKNNSFFTLYRVDIIKMSISLVLFVVALFVQNEITKYVSCISAAIVVGYELVLNCIKSIVRKEFLDENTLMLIASITAFILGESYEGVLIVLLFTLGEFLEGVATNNSRKKIAGLSELKVYSVHLISKKGISDVKPEEVTVGSFIEIKKGERIPNDGILMDSVAELDMRTITGESKVYAIKCGEKIYSGAINIGNSIVVRTEKLYKDSTVEKIISMVEGSTANKAKTQKFITSFARLYTPIVVFLTILIAVLPPLFDGLNFAKWIYKGLSFLVISCPCALVISIPLSFFVGIGGLAKCGVLVKGSNFLESLASTEVVVMDKTGTITKGNFQVSKISLKEGFLENDIKNWVCAIERSSTHPISKAIVERFGENKLQVCNVKEIPGMGMSGEVDGKTVLIGNQSLLENNGIKFTTEKHYGTEIFVAVNGKHATTILIEDEIKPNCKNSINELKRYGVRETAMISGDNNKIAKSVADQVGIDKVYAELLPDQKVEHFKKIKEHSRGTTIYVGDGINDSPTLALADVGVAMGGLGSEIAIECSDVVIMDDDISKVPLTIKQAKKIRRTVVQNIIGSLGVKFTIMILSLAFTVPIGFAMFADVGVMLLAVLNACKNGKPKNNI